MGRNLYLSFPLVASLLEGDTPLEIQVVAKIFHL